MNRKNQVLPSAFESSGSKFGLLITIALVVLFTSAAAFGSTPQGTFDKTLSVSGPVDLEVLTHSGDVRVRAGSSGSVQIHGKIYVGDRWFGGRRDEDVHAIEQNPPIRQSGNSIHIEYVNYRNISIDYEITVPADTTVRTKSGSGDQTIEGTRGNAELQTGSGDVRLTNLQGEIRVQTGSGNVRARQVSGAVRGGTGSGDVEIEETGPGDVDCIRVRGTSPREACRAASTAKLAAVKSLPKVSRAARGMLAPGPAMCDCGCRRMPRLMRTFRPVPVPSMSAPRWR